MKLKPIYYEKLILAVAVIFAPGSALHVSAQETQRGNFIIILLLTFALMFQTVIIGIVMSQRQNGLK